MQLELYDTCFHSLNIRLEKIGSVKFFIWKSQWIFSNETLHSSSTTLSWYQNLPYVHVSIFLSIFLFTLYLSHAGVVKVKKTLEGVNIAIFGSNMIWKSYYIHVHLYDIFFHIMNFFYHFFYHFKCFVIE